MKSSSIILSVLAASASLAFAQEKKKAPELPVEPVHENSIQLVPTFTGLKIERPVAVVIPPDGTGREFLVQQRGQIKILPKDRTSSDAPMFLDLSDRNMEEKEFEEGLLGLAFHPKFKDNGKFYLYYSQQGPKRSVVSEMQVSKDDPNKADPSTEKVLLEVRQPFWNHNSGNLLFGPDGYLFICFGDGGKRDDPLLFGQNMFVLHGKMIRIDVDSSTDTRPYGIPKDNPFVGKEGIRDEIWAYGLRNPWGIAIDDKTGKFWLADVGQNQWEEVNIMEKGGNYGWSHKEGVGKFVLRESMPEDLKAIDPIHVYGRLKGISITGGYVYYGTKVPAWKGYYIFGDWGTGRIWAMKDEAGANPEENAAKIYERPASNANFKPTAFYPDANGEMLVLSWDGKVYEIAPK